MADDRPLDDKLDNMAERGSAAERRIARSMLRKRGRRPKSTPGRIAKLLIALRAGNTREAAAGFAGITRVTLYRWMLRSDALRNAVEKAESEAEVSATTAVRQAFGSSWQAAAWWLERRRPQHYRRRDNMEVSGPEGGPIEHTVNDLSTEERRQLKAAIRRVREEFDAGTAGGDRSGARLGSGTPPDAAD